MRYTSSISICTVPHFLAEADPPPLLLPDRPCRFSISAGHAEPGRRPRLEEIHWLAGLFEGEGTFATDEMKIPQKEPEILSWVLELFGGRVLGPHSTRSTYTGKTYWRYVWVARGARGRSIAYTIYHFLSTRRRAQARAFLRFISRDDQVVPIDPRHPTAFLWDWMDMERRDYWCFQFE